MQRNWIGRSEGALVDFAVDGDVKADCGKITGIHYAHRHDLWRNRCGCCLRSIRRRRRLRRKTQNSAEK